MDKDLTWQKAIIILKDAGVQEIQIGYSGSGDSGGINEVSYFDNKGEEIHYQDIDINHDELQDLCYPFLNDIEDWWNNDGGQGLMTVMLDTLEYDIKNEVNHMESETYKHNGSLKSVIKDI